MNIRTACSSLCLLAAAPLAGADQGLLAPAADTLWPQWQARITVQSASVSPLTLSRIFEATAPARGLQGGAMLGDYYFAQPWFGSFRASGGLLVGSQGGLPLASAWAGPGVSLALNSSSTLGATPGAEVPGTSTYLGLGFSGAAWRSSLELTADLGLVSERPGAAAGVGRALFGNQGMESALREMRLSPMLQLGLRYTF